MNWIETTVGEYCPFVYGKGLPKTQRTEGDIPVFGSNGCVDYHNKSHVNGPGIIIGRKGSVGAVHLSVEPFWPIDTSFYVEKESIDELKFTYYLLKSLGLEGMNSDSAVPGLNRENAHALPIRIPEKTEDREKLGKWISVYDSKIELNRQTNQTLEQIAQAMFKSWFVDFEPVRAKIAANIAGENVQRAAMAAISGKNQAALDQLEQQHPEQYQQLKATADLFPDNLIDSELGEIPEGWGVKSLGEVTSAVIDHRGKTPLKLGGDWAKEGYPAISAKNIKNGRLTRHETIRFLDEALYSKWMKVELEKGDIFLTSEAPLGEMYFLTDNTKYCLSQRLYALRADNLNVTPSFLYLWLQTPQAKTDLESRATGTTVVGIRQSELKKVNSIVPTLELLNLFENVVFEMFENINKNETESQRLANLRDLLLPRLLSGKDIITD